MIRIRITYAAFSRCRAHYAVSRYTDGWAIEWWTPTKAGHHCDGPIKRGYRTKALALSEMRQIRTTCTAEGKSND